MYFGHYPKSQSKKFGNFGSILNFIYCTLRDEHVCFRRKMVYVWKNTCFEFWVPTGSMQTPASSCPCKPLRRSSDLRIPQHPLFYLVVEEKVPFAYTKVLPRLFVHLILPLLPCPRVTASFTPLEINGCLDIVGIGVFPTLGSNHHTPLFVTIMILYLPTIFFCALSAFSTFTIATITHTPSITPMFLPSSLLPVPATPTATVYHSTTAFPLPPTSPVPLPLSYKSLLI